MKRKTTTTEVKEEWQPTDLEVKAFYKFIEPFMVWKEARDIIFFQKPIHLKAGKGYKDTDGKNQAMKAFGAIDLVDYAGGKGNSVVVKQSTSNEFMKSGFGKVMLLHQFDILEKKYFNKQYAEQKSLEFFDQEGQANK